MARGNLRLYLGAAPGVGKTYAMLNEGWRRRERGTDVVVAWVDTHGRPHTEAQLRDLEVVPPRQLAYRGGTFEEMDLDAVLARAPELALVDELAHTNVPGSRHEKRWLDVEELLEAGINVVSTVNLQHLESLNDVVERITGVAQRETVPDRVVRAADQLELVDMTPEALRRRLAHGNVYPAERIDAALSNYFRPGNLTALRELALLWMADRVDLELHAYRERHGIGGLWETKERIVVSLTGAPASAVLVRRAARMAMRTKAELIGVHVQADDEYAGTASETDGLARNRSLLAELGGRYVEVVGADVAPALVQVARAENATQLVLGATHRSRFAEFVRGSVINSVIREAGGALDVHVIATDAETARPDGSGPDEGTPGPRRGGTVRPRPHLFAPLPVRRRVAAVVLGVVGFPLLTVLLTAGRGPVALATALSSYLLVVVAVAAVGGVWPAALAALAGFLLSNYYFAPPVHTLTIANERDLLALVIFLVTAGAVSILVDVSARRSAAATRARTDARMLTRVAGRLVSPDGDPLPALLDELVTTFGLEAASVLRSASVAGTVFAVSDDRRTHRPGRDEQPAVWTSVADAGAGPPLRPDDATVVLPLTDREVLALRGPGLVAEDRDVLAGVAAQLAIWLESGRLRGEIAEVERSGRTDELRAAVVRAVSHELPAPLASIRAAAADLLARTPDLGGEGSRDVLDAVLRESDHLGVLVEHLLDVTRLRAGPPGAPAPPADVAGVVTSAIPGMGRRARGVVPAVPAHLPAVGADPERLQRAVVNLVDAALEDDPAPRVEAGSVAGHVDVRVVDRGPGLRSEDRDMVAGRLLGQDARHGVDVGLRIAVARALVEADGGQLDLEDTPGGGWTAVVRLPVASRGTADGHGASAALADGRDLADGGDLADGRDLADGGDLADSGDLADGGAADRSDELS